MIFTPEESSPLTARSSRPTDLERMMEKEREEKDDSRYIIFYTFEDDGEPAPFKEEGES